MNSYIVEYLFLNFQQFWSLSLALTFVVFFGRFYSYKSTETISKNDLEIILAISIVGAILVLITTIWHFVAMVNSRKTGIVPDKVESTLKTVQHVTAFVFFLAVAIVSAVYLNQGKITESISLSFTLVGTLIFALSLGTTIFCFYKTYYRTYKNTVLKAASI